MVSEIPDRQSLLWVLSLLILYSSLSRWILIWHPHYLLSVVYCTQNRYHTNFFSFKAHERMGHLLLVAVVHLLNPLYVDAFSVRIHFLSLNTCTYNVPRNCCGSENLNESWKKSMLTQFVHTRLCKISRQEQLDLIQKFGFSICEN